MKTRIIAGVAIILTALALVPSGAHLFSLPNKISLAESDYFLAQSLYRGWSFFGAVLICSLLANAALAIVLRGKGTGFYLASAAALCIGLVLVVFLTMIYPVNQMTHNWTVIPDDWTALRLRWEAAHAINAAVTFAALCCVTAAALTKKAVAWP